MKERKNRAKKVRGVKKVRHHYCFSFFFSMSVLLCFSPSWFVIFYFMQTKAGDAKKKWVLCRQKSHFGTLWVTFVFFFWHCVSHNLLFILSDFGAIQFCFPLAMSYGRESSLVSITCYCYSSRVLICIGSLFWSTLKVLKDISVLPSCFSP